MLRAGFSLLILHLAFVLPVLAAPINYEKEVLPFLKDNCIACHNKTTTKAGLNMETPELMMKGGENGKGIEAGAGAKSLIYQAAAGEWDSEMPPKSNKVGASPLDEAELALLKQWIDEGAHHSGKQEKVIAWEPLPAAFAPIFAAGISPDGSHAAAARGNQVSIYHVPTGQLVTKLTDEGLLKSGLYKKPGVAHRDIVPALIFTADGQRLLTGSYREVKVWKRTAVVLGPASTKLTVKASEKFSLAAGATPDIVVLKERAGDKVLRELKHGAAIMSSKLSHDEQVIATAGADHKIKLWETATGKLMRELTSDGEAERALAEATDALARATVETAWRNEMIKKAEKEVTDLTARLKKANELSDLAKKSLEEKKKEQKAKSDAKVAAEKALKEVDDQIAKLAAGTKPDEALAKKQAEAREKAEKAANEAKAADEGLKRAENAVADTAEEITVVTASSTRAGEAVKAAQNAAGAAKNAQDEATAAKAAAEKAAATAIPAVVDLAFSPGGAEIAALDAAGMVRFWSTRTGLSVAGVSVKESMANATTLNWASYEDFVGVGSLNSKAELMVPDPAKSVWKLERTLGTGDGKSPITDRVNALALSPDGQTLAAGSGEPSRSGDITLWNLSTGKMTAHYDERHVDSVLSLAFSPDGRHLASGGADKAVRVTELASGKMVKLFEGHTHHVLGVAWRADGRILASAGADNVVKVWDWTTGDRRKSVDGWDKEVTALRYLGGSDTAATTSGDGQIRLINSDGGTVKALAGAAGFINAVSASRFGNLLIAGGETGVLHLWDVGAGKEIWKAGAE